ncbi:MAG TPA: SDR family NAD(P)-dependent oxidoreductase, partial [Candidatus Dormibacteraeota bacterium]|nr:SDR family NAD(P)-dependent oxidoreductase [Candidatus Dormibacteraeota bacterium]
MPAERHGLIVTGASSGIGRELVRIAADRGYAILAIARRRERLESLRAELQKRAPLAILVADITAAEAPARIAEAARAQLPRIDIVLHNAGSASPGDLLAQSDARLVEQWELHLGAPLRITRALLP